MKRWSLLLVSSLVMLVLSSFGAIPVALAAPRISKADPPPLQFSPTAVNLVTTPGVSPAPQEVVLQNTGTAASDWTAGPLPPWVSVSPTSGTLGAGDSQALTLTFSIASTTPQTYSMPLVITDTATQAQGSLPVTVAAASASTTWYFAEGYTGGSFSEYLTLENPNATATTTSVTYLLDGGQAPIIRSYSLDAHSRKTIYVKDEVGADKNNSVVVTAAQPIIAERPMYFTYTALPGYTIPGGTDVLGATSLSQQFDFGYLDTTPGHDPYLTFLNANASPMHVTIQYFGAAGGTPTTTTRTYPANSRGTINVRTDEGLPAGTYSALVSLDEPGLVERPMYLKDSVTGYTGSADVVGVANPQTDWYFAEGYTNTNFNERYYLSDPDTSATATGTLTFFLSDGTTKTAAISIPPGGQQVISANAVLGTDVNNSAQVSANLPILAERFMSFDYTAAVGGNQHPDIPGATDVLGTGSPSNLFYFAEGYNGTGFAEYLTIENPNPTYPAAVTVTFFPDTGAAPTVANYTIPTSSRFTLFTADVLPNSAFSMQVESNIPIVAERPMYFNYLSSGQTGGSDVIGYQAPGMQLPASPSTVYAGSTGGTEYALNAGTGSQRWSFQPGENGSFGGAVVVDGIMYGTSADYDSMGFPTSSTVYALHTSDGSEVWHVTKIGNTSLSVSVVADGIVYVDALDFDSENNITGSTVYALHTSDGSEVWHVTNTSNTHVSITSVVADGIVYVVEYGLAGLANDGTVYALHASDGSEAWHFTTTDSGLFWAVVAGGIVYVTSTESDAMGFPTSSTVYALHASDGSEAWHFTTTGGLASTPVVVDSVVYISMAYFDSSSNLITGTLYALNASTGTQFWSFQKNSDISIELVANGMVYVGDEFLTLYGLNASTGEEVWHFGAEGMALSSGSPGVSPHGGPSALFYGVVFANGLLYFTTNFGDSGVYALDANTGALVWHFQRTDFFTETAPVVSQGVVYFDGAYTSSDTQAAGFVYALKASDGTLYWDFKTASLVNGALIVAP